MRRRELWRRLRRRCGCWRYRRCRYGFYFERAYPSAADRRAYIDRAIAKGHTRLGSQVRTTRALHKDGRKLYADLSFGLVADDAGRIVGALAVGRDATSRYLEERALREKLASEHPARPGD